MLQIETVSGPASYVLTNGSGAQAEALVKCSGRQFGRRGVLIAVV